MAKRNKPRAGSRAYAPRKRSKSQKPRVHYWPTSKGQALCGFVGYKAGMTHVHAIDDREGRVTHGMEIFIPATVIDAPPINVVGIRAYKKGYLGDITLTDVVCDNPPAELKKAVSLPKKTDSKEKLARLKEQAKDLSDIRIIVSTQPVLTSTPQKKPHIMELGLSGSIEEKLAYASEHLGKQLSISDAFKENTFADVIAVTKGKGFQGIIKRFGVRRQPRKSTQKRRHLGSGGPITPSKKLWFWPTPGQTGYHTRTEYNKAVLKIGSNGTDVTPAGGFLSYGPVKGDYLLLKGSIPGPAKRLIRLTTPRRQKDDVKFTLTHIDLASKQGT
ncbi:MAG: 50S ribosomal protein L3 [Candidatus Altiarchaeota archaeon]|nr:50S ribosomal protein L3 [Candidatus Altiarchaeota archaeon]